MAKIKTPRGPKGDDLSALMRRAHMRMLSQTLPGPRTKPAKKKRKTKAKVRARVRKGS